MRKRIIVPFRRKKEGKTDYKNRLSLLKSGKPRLVVRLSNKNVLAQLIQFNPDGDKVLLSSHSNELKKYGWNLAGKSLPAGYLVGFLLGRKAKGQEAVLDIGLKKSIKGNKIYSVVKGAIDGGLKVKCSEEMFPSQDRIEGKHIMSNTSTDFTKFKKEDVGKIFKLTKEKIAGMKNEK